MKCKIGKRLIHEWVMSIEQAGKEPKQWQPVMFGVRKFDKHKLKCKTCGGKK